MPFSQYCSWPALHCAHVPTGIDKASDANQFAGLEFCDLVARFDYAADDFVSRHHRVNRASPFVSGLMDIGMADATI